MIYPRFIVGQLFIVQSELTDGILSGCLAILGILWILASFVQRAK